jgi:hypothetical protein
MEQGPSPEADSYSACQEIINILCNSNSSLPHWHESANRPYSDPDQSSPYPPHPPYPPSHLLEVHFNIILPPTPGVNI